MNQWYFHFTKSILEVLPQFMAFILLMTEICCLFPGPWGILQSANQLSSAHKSLQETYLPSLFWSYTPKTYMNPYSWHSRSYCISFTGYASTMVLGGQTWQDERFINNFSLFIQSSVYEGWMIVHLWHFTVVLSQRYIWYKSEALQSDKNHCMWRS